MGDPESGRYKAFLFVGIAYFFDGGFGASGAFMVSGRGLQWLYGRRDGMVVDGGHCRRDWRLWRFAGLRRQRDSGGGDVDYFCRRADCERRCLSPNSTAGGRFGGGSMAFLLGDFAGGARRHAGHSL